MRWKKLSFFFPIIETVRTFVPPLRCFAENWSSPDGNNLKICLLVIIVAAAAVCVQLSLAWNTNPILADR